MLSIITQNKERKLSTEESVQCRVEGTKVIMEYRNGECVELGEYLNNNEAAIVWEMLGVTELEELTEVKEKTFNMPQKGDVTRLLKMVKEGVQLC